MRNNVWKIYMLSIISFLVGATQFVIVGILDKIALSAGISLSTAGQLNTIFSLAYAIGTPIVVMQISTLNRRTQLMLALAILLSGIMMTVCFKTFSLMLASRAVLGVGAGVLTVTAYSTAGKLAVPGKQASALSNITLGFSAAIILGVPIGRVVAAAYEWQVIFWGIGFLSLLSLVGVAKIIPPLEGDAPISFSKQVSILKTKKNLVSLSLTLLTFFSYSVIYMYITPFLTSIMEVSEKEISMILFMLGIASLIGSKLGGVIADRVGVEYALISNMLIQAGALGLLSLLIGVSNELFLLLLLILWTASCWTFMPVQTLNLVILAPTVSGIILSLNGSFVQIGFAMGAGFGGLIVDSFSVGLVSWVGAGVILLTAVIAKWSFNLVEKNAMKDIEERRV